MFIRVNIDKCTGCGTCLTSCPFDAIVMTDEKAGINELCQLCRSCLTVCPEGAISEVQEAASLLRADMLDFPLLVQGSAPRTELLARFRDSGDAVLLGRCFMNFMANNSIRL